MFPDRARRSRRHYPGGAKNDRATWHGREVKLDDNSWAQKAWERYSGCPLRRASGYSVRHVFGHPWDPDSFTAGWNLCYMPFWAGMLTERQHRHQELTRAIRQAAWDLYFRDDPVCDPPEFVADCGIDLNEVLDGRPVRVLNGPTKPPDRPWNTGEATSDGRIREIRKATHQSWSNLLKAVRALQKKPHEAFGTPNVAATAKAAVRRIVRETGIDLAEVERRLSLMGPKSGA